MEKFHKVNICGREELLPILPLPSGINIAFFNFARIIYNFAGFCLKIFLRIKYDKRFNKTRTQTFNSFSSR